VKGVPKVHIRFHMGMVNARHPVHAPIVLEPENLEGALVIDIFGGEE